MTKESKFMTIRVTNALAINFCSLVINSGKFHYIFYIVRRSIDENVQKIYCSFTFYRYVFNSNDTIVAVDRSK